MQKNSDIKKSTDPLSPDGPDEKDAETQMNTEPEGSESTLILDEENNQNKQAEDKEKTEPAVLNTTETETVRKGSSNRLRAAPDQKERIKNRKSDTKTEADADDKKKGENQKEKNDMKKTETSSAVQTEDEKALKKEKRRKIILRTLMAICVVVMAVSGFMIYQIWNRNHVIETETAELKQYLTASPSDDNVNEPTGEMEQEQAIFNVDWTGLKAANPNVTAWLIVPGTGISFPVVQASDNSYYLTHSFTGEYNSLGAVFLDSTQNPDYRNDNSIIYAHSVDIGGMFTNLKDFENLDFFDAHPYFWLLTPDQNYRCTVNAFYMGSDDATVYTTDFGDYKSEVMSAIEHEALYYRPLDYGDHRFVTLSTCNLDYGLYSNQRYVLMGMMEPWSAPIEASVAD